MKHDQNGPLEGDRGETLLLYQANLYYPLICLSRQTLLRDHLEKDRLYLTKQLVYE